jgi:hypothetical protein
VRDLLCEDLGDALERGLGSGVGALARPERRDAVERGDLHDVPAAPAAEMGQHGAGHVQGAEQVGLELPSQVLVGQLLEGAEEPVPRVVDHHVDAPEGVERPGDGVVGLVRVGDVEAHRDGLVRVGGLEVRDPRGLARRRDDPLAALQHGLGERAPEAGGGAGDEPHARSFSRGGHGWTSLRRLRPQA